MVSRSAASGGPQNKDQRAVTRIDQNAPVNFTFDGRSYRGFAGDTLASALLANNVHLVGRSFNITGRAASWQRVPKSRTR